VCFGVWKEVEERRKKKNTEIGKDKKRRSGGD